MAELPNFGASGLVPAIVQDADTGQVRMLGYMNREALERTQATGTVWFWSRSRGRLWQKGETSGHALRVERIIADCDGDALLILARPSGPTCHTGAATCFHQPLDGGPGAAPTWPAGPETIAALWETIQQRKRERPEGSYVAHLLDQGIDTIAKKIGEEAAEAIVAAKNGEPAPLAAEAADLVFHLLVLLAASDVDPAAVWHALEGRRGAPRRHQPPGG
jgi:phosphoribosyl-ATP pyrophosphohydrolase/phosphoribosyl-AMP cyclohydrolase